MHFWRPQATASANSLRLHALQYIRARSGLSTEVDNDLLRVAKYKDLNDWKKCTVLLIDKMYMYVKEDLVYDKNTRALVGITNLGETNEHLLKV